MIVFRVCDSRFPFLWTAEGGARQAPARWHGAGEGPVQYFADTPDGAWAELLRHEEITDAADLGGIAALLWALTLDDVPMKEPNLPLAALTSDPDGYEACRAEARRLRALGATRITTHSAAVLPGEGAGYRVTAVGLERAPPREAKVIAHFGTLSEAEGWRASDPGAPPRQLLPLVRHFGQNERSNTP